MMDRSFLYITYYTADIISSITIVIMLFISSPFFSSHIIFRYYLW